MVGHQLNYHDSPGRFQFSEQLYIQWRVVIYKRKGGAGYENCRISGIGRKNAQKHLRRKGKRLIIEIFASFEKLYITDKFN